MIGDRCLQNIAAYAPNTFKKTDTGGCDQTKTCYSVATFRYYISCKKLPLFERILSRELRSCSSDEPDDNVPVSPQHTFSTV